MMGRIAWPLMVAATVAGLGQQSGLGNAPTVVLTIIAGLAVYILIRRVA